MAPIPSELAIIKWTFIAECSFFWNLLGLLETRAECDHSQLLFQAGFEFEFNLNLNLI